MQEEKPEINQISRTAGDTNLESGYILVSCSIQTRNSGETVRVTDVLDDTEGLAAMDTLPLKNGTRNLDIGGGRFDEISTHLMEWYDVQNLVYDPFNRSHEHNNRVLEEVEQSPVDSVTSNSVLNLLLDEDMRRDHIELAYKSLKSGGMAFFKIWRGNNSGIFDGLHANRESGDYVKDIQRVFGQNNVERVQDDIGNTIFAYKR